ncbi:YeeE/YedE family protein [Nitrosomonas eutropha]|uniref:YeeE/YedE family protein n=2 Tax=Nitrosomonas eutropha TaxID=916 RepID=A0ABX5M8Y7_9PROT|nr:YeeE/YedE family protein [Nitrosomonas eutropha]ABI60732.1 protein of unknown function DUF395, YeeE/YedE [Nitrosomonas eutropha C91]PXV79414.1 hypothetical protein C8R14_12323 [Nitrosomonas eutropha]SEI48857.1 hypothetical protein SAMN05216318_10431 [Nitrosomonas eutropha]
MLILIAALLSGLIFGLGLILSGMTDPAKVLAFLDVAGSWDPSLALVMLGAISIGFLAFRAAKQRGQTLLSAPLHLPVSHTIDRRLILGSLLFGAGWGLAGLCPGPSLVLAASGHSGAIIFMMAMLLGMIIFDRLEKYRQAVSKPNDRQQKNIGRE